MENYVLIDRSNGLQTASEQLKKQATVLQKKQPSVQLQKKQATVPQKKQATALQKKQATVLQKKEATVLQKKKKQTTAVVVLFVARGGAVARHHTPAYPRLRHKKEKRVPAGGVRGGWGVV